MELLHLLELRQLVMLTQPVLDGLVLDVIRRVGHEVEDAAQALLWEKVHHWVKLQGACLGWSRKCLFLLTHNS
jgi:hypothetical protein